MENTRQKRVTGSFEDAQMNENDAFLMSLLRIKPKVLNPGLKHKVWMSGSEKTIIL